MGANQSKILSLVPKYDNRDSGTAKKETSTGDSDSTPEVVDIPHEVYREQKKKFLKQAKTLFKFFLPLEFSSALVAKYWGAVHALIKVNSFSPVLISAP